MRGRSARGRRAVAVFAVAAGFVIAPAAGQDRAERPGKGGERRGSRGPATFLTSVPEVRGSVVLGRPTDRSVTLNVLLGTGGKAVVAFGPRGGALARRSPAFDLTPGEPREVVLDGLETNAAFAYHVLDAVTGEALLPEDGHGSFRTARAPGEAFAFTVQSDSHLDGNSDPALYEACLGNVRRDEPDFHLDLGDTFMTGKHPDRESASRHYAAQRYWLSRVARSAPLYLAVGNHDGEERRGPGDDGPDGLPAWAANQRRRFFPNPVPDRFYTGNPETVPGVGLLQDWYAWTWGDALFVVLDPYRASRPTRGGTEPWNMTLGKAQYEWLARTLRTSRAKWTFVFVHQLTGGLGSGGRGGAEAALLYEWGGREADGRNTFARNRPGWEKPVHALLVENRVTAVFHGHDHFFARQELDGVVYQLVPQPARRRADVADAAEYGYRTGESLPGAGHLRVRVEPGLVRYDFVRAALGAEAGNGATVGSWTIAPRAR